MPTFNIFKEGVLSLYKEKKSKQEMDELLASPSPANLRDYCLVRLSEGLPETDIQVFQKFFNPLKKEKSLEDAIYNYKTGWLRALQKFILGETENPDELLVKLLAVLVDYQPRPFKYSNDPPTTGEPGNTPTTGEPGNTPTTGEPGNTPTTGEQGKTPTTGEQGKTPTTGGRLMRFYKNNRIAVRFSTSSSLIVITFYIIYCLTPKGCMYWNDFRYVETKCQSSIPFQRIIGFNNSQFKSFFKITRPDTLSKRDVGIVWYSKIDNEVEFFTGPGFHPIETKKGLKLATEYIIETYAGENAKIKQNKRLRTMGKQ